MTTEDPKALKTFDPVGEYLKLRDCPSHVVKAGLKGLVMTWEKVVHELVFDGYRYGLRDFANDLDRRDILGGAVEFMKGAIPEAHRARIAAADKRFIEATHGASRCLLDDDAVTERHITRESHWWFFRLPRRQRPNFTRDVEAAGIVALPDEPPTSGVG